MKIKKKELRRGMAQLPINYPDPEVHPEALPGGTLNFDAERMQVEMLCKRLAHNEVVVRDAALDEVPRYLARVTATLAQMEEDFIPEIASVAAYAAAHPKTLLPYKYDNIPLALYEYRQRAQLEDQRLRRRQANRELKQQREARRLAAMNYGHFGADAAEGGSDSNEAVDEEDRSSKDRAVGKKKSHSKDDDREESVANEHKIKYSEWMQAWCDAELLFLKLARGLHFCLWHSDKPLVQLACAQRIADLIDSPATTRSKVLFYGSLFRVLAREWPTIDRYRMDKYLALARRMVYSWISLVRDVSGKEALAAASQAGMGANGTTIPICSKSSTTKAKAGAAAAPEKKRKTPTKRSRDAKEDNGGEEETSTVGDGEDATLLSAANSARGISAQYLQKYYSRHSTLRQALQEIFYIMQVQIIPSTTSVGLTMHICDVAFDELTKAYLPVPLFITLAAGIPLYAMSQGNCVEKRVLDNFFPPLAGGVFTTRRAAQLLKSLQTDQKKRRSKGTASGSAPALSAEELQQEAERLAAMDNDALLGEMARCCQLYSVSRGTSRSVRVMFSEAELVLQQSRNPDAYKTLTRTAQRRRIEHEIEEVNETRTKVREERTKRREAKREEQKGAMREKVRSRREAMLKAKKVNAASEVDESSLEKEIIEEEKERKAKKPARDTKRKKNYKLTKKDLYGEGDSDDDRT